MNEPTTTDQAADDLAHIISRTVAYYDTLRERGIPEALAVRVVGDWFNVLTVSAGTHFEGRMRKAERMVNRTMAEWMGKSE